MKFEMNATRARRNERTENERAEKLAKIEEQVASGSLVIRQMTPEEREKWSPVTPAEKPKTRGRRRKTDPKTEPALVDDNGWDGDDE